MESGGRRNNFTIQGLPPNSVLPTQKLKIIHVVGARPNFMKIAPIMREMSKYTKAFDQILVHTGQHYDINMSKIFFKELDLPWPDIDLGVGSASHTVQTANIMIKFEQVCKDKRPDWVVVVGDVNSTMACTLVTAKMGIKIAHIEAGLRSFDRTMPEEINRVVTDSLSDLLFTHCFDANDNLKKEGISDSKIKLVGNIMIDTIIANLDKARKIDIYKKWGINTKEFVYVTLHRPSNVDKIETINTIMEHIIRLASKMPVIFPIHPRTKKRLSSSGLKVNNNHNIKIMDPIGYHDSICLAENARFVITDSGGLQEETTFFQTPCLTLRPNTERPITITEGSNKLTDPDNLWIDIEKLLKQSIRMGKIPKFWDGKTSERIVEVFKNSNKTKN